MNSELDELEVDAFNSPYAFEDVTDTPEGEDNQPQEFDVKELQRELKALNSRLSESERKSNYWYEQANQKLAHQESDAEVQQRAAQVKRDFGSLFISGDTAPLDEYLADRGYVRKDEAAQMIESKAQQYTTLSKYQQEYPDLLDESSELFQVTRQYAQEMMRDADFRNIKQERIAELAIRSALADTGARAGKALQQGNDRVVRINRQRGYTNTRQPEKQSPGQLNDDEKRAARMFGITDKQYMEQKKRTKFFRAGQ
jgi:hypothetical protein